MPEAREWAAELVRLLKPIAIRSGWKSLGMVNGTLARLKWVSTLKFALLRAGGSAGRETANAYRGVPLTLGNAVAAQGW